MLGFLNNNRKKSKTDNPTTSKTTRVLVSPGDEKCRFRIPWINVGPTESGSLTSPTTYGIAPGRDEGVVTRGLEKGIPVQQFLLN